MDCTPSSLSAAAKCLTCIPRGILPAVKTMLMAKWAGCVDPTFSPLNIAGLALWLDANKGVHLTGSNVDQWDDQSGNGIVFTQSPDTNDVTFAPGGINGHPALLFNNAALITASLGPALPMSIFAVLNITTSGADEQCVIGCNGNLSALFCDRNLNRRVGWWNGTGDTNTDNPAYTDGVSFLCELINDGIAAPSIFTNGVSQICSVPNTNHFGLNAGPMVVGMADSVGGFKPLNGYIGEILVYNSAVSTSNRQAIESYLRSKWGTP